MRFIRAMFPEKTYGWDYATGLKESLFRTFGRTSVVVRGEAKKQLPLLLLETAGNTTANRHLICVDLDKVSDKLCTGATPLFRRISEDWPAMAVSPTWTGVKIFLTVQGDLPRTAADFATLKDEVKEQFFDRIAAREGADPIWSRLHLAWDDAVISLTRCFATAKIGEAAMAGVAAGVQVVRWGVGSGVKSRTIVSNLVSDSSNHRFNPYEDTLPTSLSEFIGIGVEAKKREAFLRILLNLKRLQNSFDLPQTKLAEQLNVSVSMINKWLKELRLRGWLQVLDHSYCPGLKAKSYKATTTLLYAMQDIHTGSTPLSTNRKALPLVVEKGRWYTQCLGALWYFRSEEAFIEWASKLPGITPTRLKEATKYARCHYRKLERCHQKKA